MFKCADNICNSSKDFPELKVNSSKIVETIKTEEIKYLKTLGKGIELIDDHLETKSELDGETVFKLYDTYGFPFEITEEIANEKNIKIDKAGYEKLMEKQKTNARNTKIFTDKSKISFEASHITEFLDTIKNNLQSEVLDIYYNDETTSATKVGDEYLVILLKRPCILRRGQHCDIGSLSSKDSHLEVTDVQKVNNTIIHQCKLTSGRLNIGDSVTSSYDSNYRKSTASNHSSTHLLHHYLRKVLGNHVQQRGSSVTNEGFRFDFTHTKVITAKELIEIENLVQGEINLSTATKKIYYLIKSN